MGIELSTFDPSTANNHTSSRFDPLTDFLKTHMSDIRVKEYHGDQITYVILDDAQHTKMFPTMLAELDRTSNQYRIKSYGLSNSSLEQVFLRVADEIKRPEDYERLSCWGKLRNRLRKVCCCGKKEAAPGDTEAENSSDQAEIEEEPFQTQLSGKKDYD